MTLRFVGVFFLCFWLSLAEAQEPPDFVTGKSTISGENIDPGRQKEICAPNSSSVDFIRLNLKISKLPEQDWTIEISDDSGDWTRVVSATDLFPDYWTSPIPGDCAMVRNPNGRQPLQVVSVLAPINPAEPRTFFPPGEPPDLVDPTTSTISEIRHLSKDTVMLRYMKGTMERSCSGQLLSANLLVTNNHCISDERRAKTAIVYPRFLGGDISSAEKIESVELLLTNWELDVAFLELDESATDTTFFTPWRLEEPAKDESLAIVQHPSGNLVRLSADSDCKVRTKTTKGRATGVDFGHRCDTGDGSSGSVVYSQKRDCSHIVGLHHWGFIDFDDDAENQAVHVTKIREFLLGKKESGTEKEKAAADKILSAITFTSCST